MKNAKTTKITILSRLITHFRNSGCGLLLAGLAPLPAHALDPTAVFPARQSVTIAGCNFDVVNSYVDVPGLGNDTFQAGIIVTPISGSGTYYTGGYFYSGTSDSLALEVPTFSFRSSVCNTATQRLVSHGSLTGSLRTSRYGHNPGITSVVQVVEPDGRVTAHTMAIIDTQSDTPVGVVAVDYNGSIPEWQGTTVTIGSAFDYHVPVADAGADQSVPPGATVTLDGTGTYDLDGDLSTASWFRTSGPAVTLDTTSAFQPTFVAPASSTPYSVTFQIRPRDAAGHQPVGGYTYPADSDNTVTILVDPALDTDAPIITPPANINIDADSETDSAMVNFDATVSDNIDTPDRFTPVYTYDGNVISSPYTFPVGIHTVTVTANADSSGNIPAPVDFLVTVVDVSPPSLAITGVPSTITSVDPFVAGFEFSETVVGFDISDIQATGANLSDFQGNGANYSVLVTPDASGNINIAVLDGAAADTAGNLLIGANAQSVFDTLARTGEVISNAMMRRAINLLSNQPDLPSLSSRQSSKGGFKLSATQGQLNFDVGYSNDNSVWFQLRGSRSEIADADSDYVLGTIGSHLKLSDNFLLGAMLEVDHFKDTDGSAEVSGTGWLIGPYFVARHPNKPIFFDGRLLLGKTDNEISPFGTYTDKFSTERVLATLRMAGDIDLKPLSLMPFLSLQHTSDKQIAYVDNVGTAIPSHRVALTELALGVNVAYPLVFNNGAELALTGGVSGVFSDTTQSGSNQAVTDLPPDFRSRLELGLQYEPSEQHNLTLDMSFDGLGVTNFDSYGIGFTYRFDF